MAENGSGGNPSLKDGGVPSTTLQIHIAWDQVTGAINVSFPQASTVVIFGMLEAAKNTVQKHVDANAGKVIMPASGLRM